MYYAISFALMIAFTVAANLCLKAGALVPAAERTIPGFCDWRTLLGFAFFGTSAVIYSGVLQSMPLNLAQSIAASQFVAVILASAVILAEPIPPLRLLGILLIVAGIAIVSFSEKRQESAPAAAAAELEETAR
jgi:drug/metabolite transporter (DMT)-like permease